MKNLEMWIIMKITIKAFNKVKQIKEIVQYLNSIDYKKPMIVEIKQERKTRSVKQNNFYWVWVKILCMAILEKKKDEITNTEERLLHEDLKRAFLKPIGKSKKGYPVYSTKTLSTIEFDRFTEEIRMAAIEHYGLSLFYPSDAELYDQLLTEFGM